MELHSNIRRKFIKVLKRCERISYVRWCTSNNVDLWMMQIPSKKNRNRTLEIRLNQHIFLVHILYQMEFKILIISTCFVKKDRALADMCRSGLLVQIAFVSEWREEVPLKSQDPRMCVLNVYDILCLDFW